MAPVCAMANIQPATLFHERMQQHGINSRELWLKRGKEEFKGAYALNGVLLRDGYLGACNILRDVQANEAGIIDPAILEILAAINAWLVINKIFVPIRIHSGLRTKTTNKKVGGKPNSQHLLGKAVDISIPGIPVRLLSKVAKEVSIGGIGVYVKRGFLHLDTGGNRGWEDV